MTDTLGRTVEPHPVKAGPGNRRNIAAAAGLAGVLALGPRVGNP